MDACALQCCAWLSRQLNCVRTKIGANHCECSGERVRDTSLPAMHMHSNCVHLDTEISQLVVHAPSARTWQTGLLRSHHRNLVARPITQPRPGNEFTRNGQISREWKASIRSKITFAQVVKMMQNVNLFSWNGVNNHSIE